MISTLASVKKPKSEVQYENPAHGRDHCAGCKYFEVRGPQQCLKVQGTIKATAWCKLFEKK